MTEGEQSFKNFVAECEKAEIERLGTYKPSAQQISEWADSTARCANHKDRATRPPLCAICARLMVERAIAERVIDALLSAGYALSVNDGEEETGLTTNRQQVLGFMFQTDEAWLYATRNDERPSWVRFVYGNSGYDVVSDYTTNLESVLAPVNAYADSLS